MNFYNFLMLNKWGANVPKFILNPGAICSKEYLRYYLEDYFDTRRKFSLLLSSGRWLRDLNFEDVILLYPRVEGEGIDVLVFEQPVPLFKGSVEILGEGVSVLKIQTDYYDLNIKRGEWKYGFPEALPMPVLRYIAREISLIEVPKRVELDFIWASDFVGVRFSKLVVLDYRKV